jgi:hypothetical protein
MVRINELVRAVIDGRIVVHRPGELVSFDRARELGLNVPRVYTQTETTGPRRPARATPPRRRQGDETA